MNDKLKEYAWSSLTTFLAAFLTAVLPMIGGAPLEIGFWVALILTGARAGVKAVMQLALTNKFGEKLGAKGRV